MIGPETPYHEYSNDYLTTGSEGKNYTVNGIKIEQPSKPKRTAAPTKDTFDKACRKFDSSIKDLKENMESMAADIKNIKEDNKLQTNITNDAMCHTGVLEEKHNHLSIALVISEIVNISVIACGVAAVASILKKKEK